MGNDKSKQSKGQLSVITLNYSGILLSPFEFFSKENQELSNIEINLSNIYKTLLKKQHQEFTQNKKENKFKWNLGKIDQKMQQERYSPLYNKEAGIKTENKNSTLQTTEQYVQKWNAVFDHNIEDFKKKEPNFKYTQEQRKQAVQFDLLCYQTILVHVYPELKQHNFGLIPTLDPSPYKKLMNEMFSKSFLDEQKKLYKTLKSMDQNQFDLFFVQQGNQGLVKRLQHRKQYLVVHQSKGQSIIIIRRESFPNLENDLKNNIFNKNQDFKQLRKTFLWNQDSEVIALKYHGQDLILISGHLSSKKDKNGQQIYEMIKSLDNFTQKHPCNFIIGCDANSFAPKSYKDHLKSKLQADKNEKQYEQDLAILEKTTIYPSDAAIFTTSKQRTYLQPQINKAEQMAQVCRDHLIVLGTDLHIQKTNVCTILSKDIKQASNLPCESHPFDHYVVKANVIFSKK